MDAAEFNTDEAKIALLHVPDRPGVANKIFGAMAREYIDVDLIIQSVHEGNTNDIAFTVHQSLLKRANAIAPQLSDGNAEVLIDDQISKISLTGAGMIGRPRIAADMFQVLAAAKINIQMISTSEIKVSCVIAANECQRAVEVLCEKFGVNVSSAYHRNLPPEPVRGVALDLKQAQIAILVLAES